MIRLQAAAMLLDPRRPQRHSQLLHLRVEGAVIKPSAL